MNIIFEHLSICNFLSIQNAEIDLNNRGFVLISGINESADDNAQSNGSGKTAIWEALMWALTGDTLRGTKDVANNKINDGTVVAVKFVVDDKHYSVLRAKDNSVYKTALKIEVDGKDESGKGIRDTEKILSELLPDLTAELLGSVVILGQGLPQRFTNNTPSGRKEVLEKLSRSDYMIEDIKARIENRKIKIIDEQLTAINKQLAKCEAIIETNTGKLQLLSAAVQIDTKQLSDKLTTLNAERDERQEKLSALTAQSKDFADRLKAYSLTLPQIKEDGANAITQNTWQYSDSIKAAEKALTDTAVLYETTRAECARLDSIGDVCPTCGRATDSTVKADTADAHKRLAELTELLASCKTELQRVRDEKANAEKEIRERYNAEWSQVKSEYTDTLNLQKTVENDIANIRKWLERVDKEIAETSSAISAAETRKQCFEDDKQNAENVIKSEQEKQERLQKSLDVWQERLAVNRKFSTAVARDFRGVLLSGLIEYIDKRVKHYAKIVFHNDGVRFGLSGNNISIRLNDKEYESLSSGERHKIDIITQFAIRDMMCEYLGFSSNILVLDEIFDTLDFRGCGQIVDLLTSELRDVQSVFVVTHRKDLSIPYDTEITVKKAMNGISTVL